MRPVALGRKNWLHIGDEKAGPKIAAIMSVLATCRRLGIHPRDYLLYPTGGPIYAGVERDEKLGG